jgi:hypothetical protein
MHQLSNNVVLLYRSLPLVRKIQRFQTLNQLISVFSFFKGFNSNPFFIFMASIKVKILFYRLGSVPICVSECLLRLVS